MKLYRSGKMLVIVQPGNEFPEVKEWHDETGGARLYSFQFDETGVARNVDPKIGQYMIDQNLASRSPIAIAGTVTG